MPTDSDEGRAESTTGNRRSIAREHLLGATIWAYGAGSARVRPWVQPDQLSRYSRVRESVGSRTKSP